MGLHSSRLIAGPEPVRQVPVHRYEVLDSWRGICALFVALFHLPLAGAIGDNGFVRGSFLFVDFFFVLSGFVIAHSCWQRVGTVEGLASFMITRAGRLFPLHVFMLLAFVAFELLRLLVPQLSGTQAPFTGAFSLDTLPANLALMHGLGIHDHLSWNAPSWSISTELFAYLFFAITVIALGRRSWLVFAAMLAAGPVLLFALSPDFMDATYDLGMVRCLFGFSAGVLTCLAIDGTTGNAAETGESRVAWTLSELVIIAALAAFISTSSMNAGGLLAPFIFALAVAVFAHEGGYVSKLLRMRPFLVLGAISYSIYLTHIFIQGRMLNAAKLADNRFGLALLSRTSDGAVEFSSSMAIAAIIVMVAVTIGVSVLTHRFIEMLGRDYFRKLARKRFQANQVSQIRPYGASESS